MQSRKSKVVTFAFQLGTTMTRVDYEIPTDWGVDFYRTRADRGYYCTLVYLPDYQMRKGYSRSSYRGALDAALQIMSLFDAPEPSLLEVQYMASQIPTVDNYL